MEHASPVYDFLAAWHSIMPRNDRLVYSSLADFILQHGRRFKPGRCPKSYRTGALIKQCFRNAMRLAMRRDLVYVEGYAMASTIPLPHAWCVKQNSDVVIDPTWDDGVGYFGVPIKLDYVCKSYTASKQYAVIDNWYCKWPIFTDPIEEWKL